MRKKISKSAQKRKDQKINSMIIQKFKEQERDIEKKISDKEKFEHMDIKSLNSKSLMDALKNSGMDASSDVFSDMERIVNNNESIRELVDIRNIRMKTKVTEEQHKMLVMLGSAYNTLLSRYGINFMALKDILGEFIEIAPSIDGKRAEQFVDAHKSLSQALANAHSPNVIREPNDMKGS
jgi:hypothetical protein